MYGLVQGSAMFSGHRPAWVWSRLAVGSGCLRHFSPLPNCCMMIAELPAAKCYWRHSSLDWLAHGLEVADPWANGRADVIWQHVFVFNHSYTIVNGLSNPSITLPFCPRISRHVLQLKTESNKLFDFSSWFSVGYIKCSSYISSMENWLFKCLSRLEAKITDILEQTWKMLTWHFI